jgi:hypothetical protein
MSTMSAMMTRVDGLVAGRTGLVIAAIAVVFAAAYSTSLVVKPKPDGRIVVGDALHHYVQLRSAVFDRDLHFRNEYVRMYRLTGREPGTEWVYEPTATGYVRNLMPVGPALLWAPLFLTISAVVWCGQFLGWPYPLDGYGRLFQAAAGLSGIAAAALGVWFSFRAAATVTSRRAAAWGALVIWLASSAVYYSLISPTYSHAASLLTTGAWWWYFVRTRTRTDVQRYVVLGALAGLAALMRWQDTLILAVPLAEVGLRLRRGMTTGAAAARILGCLSAAVAAFAPQMIVWQTLYGQPLAIPQGGGFMRWGQPALVPVLFSDWHGLFTWTPVVAVAVAGLSALRRRDALLLSGAAVFLALSWYVNAAAADWWAGEAFGARRFVSCVPVFTLALAALIEQWSPRPAALVTLGGAAIAHTFLLLVQYQAFMHGLRDVVPYPRGAYNLWLARFEAPFDLARWWWAR